MIASIGAIKIVSEQTLASLLVGVGNEEKRHTPAMPIAVFALATVGLLMKKGKKHW